MSEQKNAGTQTQVAEDPNPFALAKHGARDVEVAEARAHLVKEERRQLEPRDLDSVYKLGQVLADQGLFGIKSPADAVARIMYGANLGLPAMVACKSIRTFDGKNGRDVSVEALVLHVLMEDDPDFESFRWIERGPDGAKASVKKKGHEALEVSFTKADAERAGLLQKENWKNYPTDMYVARVRSRAAKLLFAKATLGLSSNEEMLDAFDPRSTAAALVDGIKRDEEHVSPQKIAEEELYLQAVKERVAAATTLEKRKEVRQEIISAERGKLLTGGRLQAAKDAINSATPPPKSGALPAAETKTEGAKPA